jgi:hypothetical protein
MREDRRMRAHDFFSDNTTSSSRRRIALPALPTLASGCRHEFDGNRIHTRILFWLCRGDRFYAGQIGTSSRHETPQSMRLRTLNDTTGPVDHNQFHRIARRTGADHLRGSPIDFGEAVGRGLVLADDRGLSRLIARTAARCDSRAAHAVT